MRKPMMIKRIASAMLALAISCLTISASAKLREDDILRQTTENMMAYFDSRESISGFIEVPGYGEIYQYFQNDPLWSVVRYNLYNKKRAGYTMAGAACGPTSAAIVLRELLTDEELIKLISFSDSGYQFCVCSTASKYCSGMHVRYTPQTAEELTRYLPLVLASYFGGNNAKRPRYVGMSYFDELLGELGVPYESTRDKAVALTALENGAIIFGNTGTRESPFTATGHYVVIISVDNGYVYVLDPYVRDTYQPKPDKKGILEIVQPGLVRTKVENIKKLCISNHIIVYPNAKSEQVATPNDLPR